MEKSEVSVRIKTAVANHPVLAIVGRYWGQQTTFVCTIWGAGVKEKHTLCWFP